MNLNQCPFCNSDDVGILGYYAFFCITCHNCGAKGPTSGSENEAWDKWQQRHLSEASTRPDNTEADIETCHRCGYMHSGQLCTISGG